MVAKSKTITEQDETFKTWQALYFFSLITVKICNKTGSYFIR